MRISILLLATTALKCSFGAQRVWDEVGYIGTLSFIFATITAYRQDQRELQSPIKERDIQCVKANKTY
jgi:hypothetical protein